MPRFAEFVIQLEIETEFKSLEELQFEFDEAVRIEDYKAASELKELIAKRILHGEPENEITNHDEICVIDLDEVAAFYQSVYNDTNEKFTKVILKGGYELPIAILLEDFKKILTHGIS